MKRYEADLNTTLIFVRDLDFLSEPSTECLPSQAGLFSAVTAGFIIDAQKVLQEDYTQTSAELLRDPLYKWAGPPDVLVHILCVLYSSMATSLLAAFIAMLGKQWLNRYERSGTRGSVIERARERQQKLEGMQLWRFYLVMESLPMMQQIAVLLLGYALSQYLWTVDHAVAAIVIGFTIVGAIVFSLIVFAGVIFHNCPFQTPASLAITSFIPHSTKGLKNLKRLYYVIHMFMKQRITYSSPLRKEADLESSKPSVTGREKEETLKSIFKAGPKETDGDLLLDVGCASWLLSKFGFFRDPNEANLRIELRCFDRCRSHISSRQICPRCRKTQSESRAIPRKDI